MKPGTEPAERYQEGGRREEGGRICTCHGVRLRRRPRRAGRYLRAGFGDGAQGGGFVREERAAGLAARGGDVGEAICIAFPPLKGYCEGSRDGEEEG